jgi:hypothetical protein
MVRRPTGRKCGIRNSDLEGKRWFLDRAVGLLGYCFTGRSLPDAQECFNERALSAYGGHAAESFEPFAYGDLGGGIEPLRELAELFWRNFP